MPAHMVPCDRKGNSQNQRSGACPDPQKPITNFFSVCSKGNGMDSLDQSVSLTKVLRYRSNGFRWPLALRYALRDFRGGFRGFGIFLGCIALGVAAITGVGSVSLSLKDGL